MAFQTQGFVQLVFCDPSPRLGGQVRLSHEALDPFISANCYKDETRYR